MDAKMFFFKNTMEKGEVSKKVKITTSNGKIFANDTPCLFDNEEILEDVKSVVYVSAGRPFILDGKYQAVGVERGGRIVAKIVLKND